MSYTIAVRALCEFTAKSGDLDVRFTPSPTSQQGIAGHITVTARRGSDYEKEVSLQGDYGDLHVRGRADGYDPRINRLEEIKTFRGDLRRIPENHRRLHWAQVETYGHLLCLQRGLASIELALVYFDIGDAKETLIVQPYTADTLKILFEKRCQLFTTWARQEVAHITARNDALDRLQFPHETFRGGQRQLAESVYKSVSTGRCLLVEAPTGIGKTLATLFPVLKAFSLQRLDKVFFLVAKTTGRALALETLLRLYAGTPSMPLRVLEIIARDKACVHPDKSCHGDSCPLAKGFYDRLPAARAAALKFGWLDHAAVRDCAQAHQVCPYYLAQELARWCDVAVGDYNYYFDSSALLHALTSANQWRIAVLVDEAHNLIERARRMYSATLDQAVLKALKPHVPRVLKAPLSRLDRTCTALYGAADGEENGGQYGQQENIYQTRSDVARKLLDDVQGMVTAIADYLAENPAPVIPQLQAFYFDAMQFARMAESLDQHSIFDTTRVPPAGRSSRATVRMCIRNVIPAPFLKSRFDSALSTILFSATLAPFRFYRDMLGLADSTPALTVDSPFQAGQLSVQIVDRVSTRFTDRVLSIAPIAELIATQFARAPGNYLAFFSSFDYLHQVADVLEARHDDIPLWRQLRGMDESARETFLAHFVDGGRGIGFAVLGGAFGEGIDLPGKRLIGAFIATLGLPQTNPVNEQVKAQIGAVFGSGYEYTYLYPGLQKVVQAAGRVIRTPEDEGIVYLIDDRFHQTRVKNLLPAWWHIQREISPSPGPTTLSVRAFSASSDTRHCGSRVDRIQSRANS